MNDLISIMGYHQAMLYMGFSLYEIEIITRGSTHESVTQE